MLRIVYFILFYLISNTVFAEIIITNFNKTINFTDFGRSVNIKMKAKVKLPKNYYYKEWSYIFDKNSKIEVYEAKIANKKYKTLFGNNELKFRFQKAFNGEELEFDFKYTEFNNNKKEYTRQEYVSIPKFAAKAKGFIQIKIPNFLAVYSLNSKFTQNLDIYNWNGIVPKDGISDIFSLTLKKAKWNIQLLTTISGNKKISKIDLKIPAYFKNGNNKIKKYEIKTNYDEIFTKIKENEDNIKIDFDKINGSLVQVKLDAILENNFDNKVWIKLDPNNYLKIDKKISAELYNTIYKIKSKNKKNIPLYILLAKWVHNNINYNEEYVAKNLNSKEILSLREGVCIHYAKLYNDLLRTYGIPSIIVSGVSYNEEKKSFENHAWNMIYANGEWISIDPTWGLYSGKIPVSHIFFYLNERPSVEYIVYGSSINNFTNDIEKSIKFIKEN